MSILTNYSNTLLDVVNNEDWENKVDDISDWILDSNYQNIFLVGNGGSCAVAMHMAEDFAKVAKIPAYSFSDGPTITCFSNDYRYENAIVEWLKVYWKYDDDNILIAISSSGESKNIINAVKYVSSTYTPIPLVTLTGFSPNNTLNGLYAAFKIHVPSEDYGIIECLHQIFLHAVLDRVCQLKNI